MMRIFSGIVLVLFGFIMFIVCITWLSRVTNRDHYSGTISGAFGDTLGQDFVSIFILLFWIVFLFGWYMLFGEPDKRSLKYYFIVLLGPPLLIWAIHKIKSISTNAAEGKIRLLHIIYYILLFFTLKANWPKLKDIPKQTVKEYFGNYKDTNGLFKRSFHMLFDYRKELFFRKEIESKETIKRYVVESPRRKALQDSLRETWGCNISYDKKYYSDKEIEIYMEIIFSPYSSKQKKKVVNYVRDWYKDSQ